MKLGVEITELLLEVCTQAYSVGVRGRLESEDPCT